MSGGATAAESGRREGRPSRYCQGQLSNAGKRGQQAWPETDRIRTSMRPGSRRPAFSRYSHTCPRFSFRTHARHTSRLRMAHSPAAQPRTRDSCRRDPRRVLHSNTATSTSPCAVPGAAAAAPAGTAGPTAVTATAARAPAPAPPAPVPAPSAAAAPPDACAVACGAAAAAVCRRCTDGIRSRPCAPEAADAEPAPAPAAPVPAPDAGVLPTPTPGGVAAAGSRRRRCRSQRRRRLVHVASGAADHARCPPPPSPPLPPPPPPAGVRYSHPSPSTACGPVPPCRMSSTQSPAHCQPPPRGSSTSSLPLQAPLAPEREPSPEAPAEPPAAPGPPPPAAPPPPPPPPWPLRPTKASSSSPPEAPCQLPHGSRTCERRRLGRAWWRGRCVDGKGAWRKVASYQSARRAPAGPLAALHPMFHCPDTGGPGPPHPPGTHTPPPSPPPQSPAAAAAAPAPAPALAR